MTGTFGQASRGKAANQREGCVRIGLNGLVARGSRDEERTARPQGESLTRGRENLPATLNHDTDVTLPMIPIGGSAPDHKARCTEIPRVLRADQDLLAALRILPNRPGDQGILLDA